MTDQPFQELPAARRGRLVFRGVLRSVLSSTVLVILYYELPLDRPLDGDTAVRVLIGLLTFTAQTRQRTPLPGQAPSGRELRDLLSRPPYHRGQVADRVRRVADLDLRERGRHCHPRVTCAHHRTGRARHPGVASLVVLAVARTCVVLRWLVTVRAFPAARTAPEASVPDPPRPACGRFADRDGALATGQSASRLA
jgi:hypothetical protein